MKAMRLPRRVGLMTIPIACLALLFLPGPLRLAGQAQEETAAAVWVDLINEARLDEGLNPYSQSRLLTAAAQRHADDLAESGFGDPDDVHRGSDGSDQYERVEESGYAAWTEDDEMVVAETVWSGQGSPQDAAASLLDDQAFRDQVFSSAYREMGVGVAIADDGERVYVLVFGARPNVLPVFINDGASSTENREVAIRLTNERVRPEGSGATFMGEAIEIRINNEPEFETLTWQPWAPLVSWILPDVHGQHTVYVQFRDAAGRTAAAADEILLDKGTPLASPSVSLTATPTGLPAGTVVPTGPATGPGEGEGTPTSEAAFTPSPPLSTSPSPEGHATPFPTWTPLPSPEPTPGEIEERRPGQLTLPSMREYRRALTVVGVLQGLVIVLGALWLLRRGRGP